MVVRNMVKSAIACCIDAHLYIWAPPTQKIHCVFWVVRGWTVCTGNRACALSRVTHRHEQPRSGMGTRAVMAVRLLVELW